MSLRKSPERTPELLDAARTNAQHSTGARSAVGKQQSKFNALRHGERAQPENHQQVMRALGEDPQEFAALKQELRESFGPGDGLLERQIDDLARLYWRRGRLERAETGLMRRALLALEERQYQRRLELEGARFNAALGIEMAEPRDPGVRLRLLLSFLSAIREQVKQREFKAWQGTEIENFYRQRGGWRPARLAKLLGFFSASAQGSAPEAGLEDLLAPELGPAVQALEAQAKEAQYQELLGLLEEEIASVEKQFEHAEKVNEERAALERDACLAPAGDEWKMLLRREETLDRSIDRKIKMLLSLRKEAAKQARAPAANQPVDAPLAGARPGHEISAPASPAPGEGGSAAAALQEKIDERTGNVIENKGPAQETTESCPVG